jgi:hypothetical protein
MSMRVLDTNFTCEIEIINQVKESKKKIQLWAVAVAHSGKLPISFLKIRFSCNQNIAETIF